MIGYVTLGAKDKEKAAAFYDALFGEMDAKRIFSNDRMIFWGKSMAEPLLGVGDPFDGGQASCGNGTMVALRAPSRGAVDALYAKALALGGSDEGAPGERVAQFYGAYFRDLDGNKFAVFYMGAAD